jgi:branched-subunit amino acid transport protein
MNDLATWALVLVCGMGTYAFRGLGVLLSGRIHTDSPVFEWAACVAYAMIAGLVMRVILFPSSAGVGTFLGDRLAACAVGVVVYFFCRRNLFAGLCGGVCGLIALNYARLVL